MSTPTTPTSPAPAGDDRNAAPVETAPSVPSFEDKLREFWDGNRTAIFGLCVVILLVITGKGLWEFYQVRRENSIAADYAKATTNDQLKAFVASNEGHVLGGVGNLRLADEAYSAAKFTEAASLYERALESLKTGPLALRARVGVAVSKLLAGDRAAGESALKALGADLTLPAAIRAEATYHLASLAAEAKDSATLQTLIEQLNAIAPESLWAQRASILRATQGLTAPSVAAPSAPVSGGPEATVTFPTKGK